MQCCVVTGIWHCRFLMHAQSTESGVRITVTYPFDPPIRTNAPICIPKDEYGTAAYKTCEIDAILDDAAVQHREVQNHESQLFKDYFDKLE